MGDAAWVPERMKRVDWYGAHELWGAPFPWFGGKSLAAPLLWEAFGDAGNYVEPFAGSLACLLARPHAPRVETVNDLDCYLANFWRALRRAPDEVAYWADRPVNEAEIHATHRLLVEGETEAQHLQRVHVAAQQALAEGNPALALNLLRESTAERRVFGEAFRERLRTEDSYCDPEVAGRWVWGLCAWIGSGWCTQSGWGAETTGRQVNRPHLSTAGHGVHALGVRGDEPGAPVYWDGRGHAGAQPRGVQTARWAQKPDLTGSRGAAGRGVHASGKAGSVGEWLRFLSERLAYVRVCCGDFRRVLSSSVTTYQGTTAVLLDPPYGEKAGRDRKIYACESLTVAEIARQWAVENGGNPHLRIALCGYEGEHAMPAGWRCVEWKAGGGYANRCKDGAKNAGRERIWLSPHCLTPRERFRQVELFANASKDGGAR